MSSPGPGRRCWAARRRTACWRCRRARSSGWQTYKPAWPLPKIFRLTSGGKLNEGIFTGETINTPSMLCVEDALDGLRWAERIGGLPALIARSRGQSRRDRRLGRGARLGRLPGRGSGDALLHLDLPEDHRAVVHRAGRGRRRRRRRSRSPRCWSAKASPTTSAAIAMRRRACASGAAPRSRPPTSRRCCPGSTGRMRRSRRDLRARRRSRQADAARS